MDEHRTAATHEGSEMDLENNRCVNENEMTQLMRQARYPEDATHVLTALACSFLFLYVLLCVAYMGK